MNDFWIKRWEDGDAPWHQADVEPLLARYFPKTHASSALVPLCGKSLDMLWIANQGCKVVGVELSTTAARSFFTENKIDYTSRSDGNFEIFSAINISIWVGDFFNLPESCTKSINFIYDRAALIALPLDIRMNYVGRLTTIAKKSAAPSFEMLVIARESGAAETEGPPFMISKEDIKTYYDKNFKIKILETINRPSNRADLPPELTETAYRLTR